MRYLLTLSAIISIAIVACQTTIPADTPVAQSSEAMIATATPFSEPTATPTPTPSPEPTATPIRFPTATPRPTPAGSPTPYPTPIPLPTATHAPPPPTYTPTATPTSSQEVPFIYDPAYGAGIDDVALAVMRQDMLTLINRARNVAGLPPVTLGDNYSVQIHTEYMRDNCIVSHTGMGGNNKRDRWLSAGGNPDVRLAENVNGYRDCSFTVPRTRSLYYYVDKLMDSLMDSAGHREIILTDSYDEVHLGLSISPNGAWVTQLFVDRRDQVSVSTANATPTPTATNTPMPRPSPTPAPTNTPTPTPTPTVTPTPTETPLPTETPTVTPTPEPTATPTVTPTRAPTSTPTPVPTPSSSREFQFVYDSRYGAGVNEIALDTMRRDMLKMINDERRRAGVPPVVLGNISSVQEHTEYMRDNCIVSNSGRGGVSKDTLWRQAGGDPNVGLAQNVNGYRDCSFTVPRSRTLYYYVDRLMTYLLRGSVATGIIIKETYDEVHIGFAISPNGAWVTQLFVDRR